MPGADSPMLALTFEIDGARYGIDVSAVEIVLPLAPARRLDGVPPFVTGVLPVLGTPLPVIDLSLLHVGRPSRRAYGTRIIAVRCGDAEQTVGLIAERVTDLATIDAARLHPAGVAQPAAPWLGPMLEDARGGFLQMLSPDRLLTDELRARLFAHVE